MEKGAISSLQALMALLWRATTRARALEAGQTTRCWLIIGGRHRRNPPIPQEYLGNCGGLACASSTAGELLRQDLGSAARAIHENVASFSFDDQRAMFEGWLREHCPVNPVAIYGESAMLVAGSPRFDIYGNDFGWGRPVGTFNGPAARLDGKIIASQGREGFGSIDLQVCLPLPAMSALLLDEELAEALASN